MTRGMSDYVRDGAEIYRRSFATIRAEAAVQLGLHVAGDLPRGGRRLRGSGGPVRCGAGHRLVQFAA